MDVQDWLARGAVADRSASSKRAALNAVAEVAARSFGLQAEIVLRALSEREAQGSTGVGQGVAVPHAQLEGLPDLRAVFVRLEAPVAFEAVDGKPVDLLFALFAPAGDSATHLRALARVSRLLRRADLREQLRLARTADAVHALLAAEATPSAA